MSSTTQLTELVNRGKRDFEAGRFQPAAGAFREAADEYARLGEVLDAAEQKNNLSVALLKLRQPQKALKEVSGTEEIFAAAGDKRRQGMAANNQAVALEGLNKLDDALAAYERAAQLLGEAGEGELRGVTLKAAAALQLRRGKLTESGLSMLGALGSSLKPSGLERLLKSILRRVA